MTYCRRHGGSWSSSKRNRALGKSKKSTQSDTVSFLNWRQKMTDAQNAFGDEWRKQFTQEELQEIDRRAESEWALRAQRYDLPGPIRVVWT